MDSERQHDAVLDQIAHHHLRITTLETRNADSLDYYEISVWNLKAALDAAYQMGLSDGKGEKCS